MAAEHRVNLGGVIDDLVEREQREVDAHHLRHRAQAHDGRANRRADDPRLGDGGIYDAAFAKLIQKAAGDRVGASVGADIFADEEDAIIALHLLAQRLADRLAKSDLRHC